MLCPGATSADLARIGVVRITPEYYRPDTMPSGSVFDALRPSGIFDVEYGLHGVVTENMTMVPDAKAHVWGYDWTYNGNGASVRRDILRSALKGRRAEARLVVNTPVSWWVVRFPDGREAAALAGYTFGRDSWANGVLLSDGVLFPARTIFAVVRTR